MGASGRGHVSQWMSCANPIPIECELSLYNGTSAFCPRADAGRLAEFSRQPPGIAPENLNQEPQS
jgi:hypothetical protein